MITFLFLLIIVGVLLYIVEHYVPMDPPFKIVIRLVGILLLAWAALRMLGLVGAYPVSLP